MIANPTYDEGREAELNIVVAGTEDGIVMVEAGAPGVVEEEVLDAIEFGHECCKKIVAGIRELMKQAGKPKREFTPPAARSGTVRQDREASPRRSDRRAEHREVREARKLSPRSPSSKKRVVEAAAEEQTDEADKLLRRARRSASSATRC